MAQALLNTKQVMAGFGVSDMTLWAWRQGSKTRDCLPFHKEGRFVSFKESEMKAYAKVHGLTWSSTMAAADHTEAVQPGPKPKLTATTAKPAKVKTAAQKMKSAAAPLPRPASVGKSKRKLPTQTQAQA